jgi:hypothetical protein
VRSFVADKWLTPVPCRQLLQHAAQLPNVKSEGCSPQQFLQFGMAWRCLGTQRCLSRCVAVQTVSRHYVQQIRGGLT